MIRKAIIVVLTLGVVVAAGLSLACYWFAFGAGYYDASRQRLYFVHCLPEGGPLVLLIHHGTTSVPVKGMPGIVAWTIADDICFLKSWQAKWTIHTGLRYKITEYRIPRWMPAAVSIVLAAYPTLACIRGPVRRWRWHRKGLCVKCGYNLTGLPEPRCPECGAKT
jgi:hypothetical protein